MGDEIKSIRENLLRSVLSSLGSAAAQNGKDAGAVDSGTARELIVTLLSRAGKGKDEVVQILAREIGFAVAAMMKEPLSQLAQHQKLQVTFEFVPKDGHEDALGKKKPQSRRSDSRKKSTPKRKRTSKN